MQQPAMPPFSPAAGTPAAAGQHATPISSRPPPEPQQQQQHQVDELGGGSASGGSSFVVEHDGGAGASAGGDDGERNGPSGGNRWPRQETLALLKIRSEMDAAFREAALKGPLWEQVARRLEAMGYKRSAKKCREKFENVDKYYKRTKDGRAGRGDGKAYRFFSELEALHGASSPAPPHPPVVVSLAPTPVAMAPPATAIVGAPTMAPPALHAEPPPPTPPQPRVVAAVPQPAPTTLTGSATATTAAPANAASDAAAVCMMTPGDVSFSSGSDGEDTEETGGGGDGGKRKRDDGDGDGSSGSKMMRFFEGLMRQVMERQEEMQRRFMEAIERREQDRMIREEAWRRQEVARLAREQDALAQERAMAASRDAAVVSFIQRVTGQTIPMPMPSSVAPPPAFITALTHTPPLQPTPVASAAPAQQPPPPPSHQLSPKPHTAMPMTTQPQPPQVQPHQAPSPATHPHGHKEIVVRTPAAESQDTAGPGGGAPSPSRWPKAEVHALIQLRTELEMRYQDSGAKGPLWEDISSGMRRLGYNRNAKRCKEKWENINKYFKKVKESNKKRPEDSKTCPYYHQLDALYRSKALASLSSGAAPVAAPLRPDQQAAPAPVTVLAAVPLSQTAPHGNGNGNGCASRAGSSDNGGGSSGGMDKPQASNGAGVAARFSAIDGAGGNGVETNKREEGIIMTKETTAAAETKPQPVSMNDSYVNDNAVDSDSSMDDDDDEDDFDDDEEEGDVRGGGNSKMQYEIQFQRQQHQQQNNQSGGGVRPNASGGAGAGPAATTSGSFLTMVHH